MLKKTLTLLLALLAWTVPALSEVYVGTTVALYEVPVIAETSGTIESLSAQVGQRVESGEALMTLRGDRTFASQDGTVALLHAKAGDATDGAVMEIAPEEKYTIYCTVDKAWQSAETTLVHSGETVYIKCTADGSHRAIGVIAQIDAEEFRVLTCGGELLVGETVYLYRDSEFASDSRVGIGTVVVSDAQVYQAEGTLTRLNVSEGDRVERGQLLYEVGGGEIVAAEAGIVAQIDGQTGAQVAKGQIVARLVPENAVGIECAVNETAVSDIAVGDPVACLLAGQADEDAVSGTVEEIRSSDVAGTYLVFIRLETAQALPLGLSVDVRFQGHKKP